MPFEACMGTLHGKKASVSKGALCQSDMPVNLGFLCVVR